MKVLNRFRALAGIAVGLGALSAVAGAWAADLKVGFITSLSGPVSSLGIPYEKGMKAALAYKADVGGRKIQLVQLDDASDPTTAARNARKMIDEDKVDVIIGTAGSPGALAIAGVARETKTPLISIANANLPGEEGAWMVTLPQPAPLMVSAVVERMKKSGVKTVGYIGFSDAWGDLVYDALQKSAEPAGIKIVSNERYARADSSVTGQVLKIVALRPDAVITGTSGTPGALPYLALAERGYKGQIYGMHALINPDFVRVGGASVEGLLAPTGPVIVAEQLPERQPDPQSVDGLPRGLPEGQRRAADRCLLGLHLRCLAAVPGRGPTRARHQGRAGHAAVPPRAARRDREHQGAGGHAQRLQLQADRPLWIGRTLACGREARKGSVEAGSLIQRTQRTQRTQHTRHTLEQPR
jgi:branched-chain amino acid transport system substrate-binding protein